MMSWCQVAAEQSFQRSAGNGRHLSFQFSRPRTLNMA
jgi:hypothetical protein